MWKSGRKTPKTIVMQYDCELKWLRLFTGEVIVEAEGESAEGAPGFVRSRMIQRRTPEIMPPQI